VLPPVLVPRQPVDAPHELPPLQSGYTRPENMMMPQEPPNTNFQLPGKKRPGKLLILSIQN